MTNLSISEQIQQMDSSKDYERIVYLLSFVLFPWDIEKSLEFALFRSYAVPSISEILYGTKEFIKRPRKRYDDTELILAEVSENGFESSRAKKAIKRLNSIHSRFDIKNEDFLYVLSTFIFEPIRWMDKFGARSFTHKEKEAWFIYYQKLASEMKIKNLPKTFEEFEKYNIDYEKTNFKYAATNQKIGESTRDLLLGFYLPKFLWKAASPFVYATMDAPLRSAFGFPEPSPLVLSLTNTALKIRSKILAKLPENKKEVLITKKTRPTYPEGYRIEELGTFER